MPETLSQIDLTPAEVAGLPPEIRRKIEAAFGPVGNASGQWKLIGTQSGSTAHVVEKAIHQVAAFAETYAAARQEKNIERLIDIIAEDVPRSGVDLELELDNAELRAAYLEETPLLSAQDVRAQSGLKSANKSEPASRWKREKKAFAVRHRGVDLYPAFQFEDGAPKPVMRKILEAMPDDMSQWQIAFWFESGNGWLDGAEPQSCLNDVEAVIYAAERLAEPTVG